MADLDLGTLRGHVDLDVDQFDRKYAGVTNLVKKLATDPIPDLVIDADTTGAQTQIGKVEKAAEVLATRDFDPKIDADITKAEAKVADIGRELEVLRRMDATPEVTADITKAEANLKAVDSRLSALRGLRAEMKVDADTAPAEKALDTVADKAADAGTKGGEKAGGNMAGKIVAALATIPVAGAVIGIGAAIGDALLDGLQNEVRTDLFSARTGLDEATAGRFARAAGEAYANNFGGSIESNMDAARIAVQSGLLDPQAAARDAQAVIESLTGVSDLLGEEYPRVARSAAQAIKTGLAGDAAGAMDLLTKASQNGLNVSEDLLDTVDEYGTTFRKVGLEGPQAFGLIAQAVRAGARDTDIAADALKEFGIRAIDGSKLTTESFQAIGLSAEDMSRRIAAGGPDAAAALDETLDKLRSIEDPAARSAAAVGLFGTQAEDMGDALFAMDLSSAVDQFGQVEGAASRALAAMGDNAAADIETARRNIEVAAVGIQGALAAAFGPQISGAATFVTENREAVMSFLLDAANSAFDLGRAMVNAAADGLDAFGDFVSEAGPAMLNFIESILVGIDSIPTVDLSEAIGEFRDMKGEAESSFATFDVSSSEAADAIRRNLIENGLDPAQAKLNDVGIPLVAQAAFHDVSLALAADLDGVGFAADGSRLAVDTLNGTVDTSTEAGRLLDAQLRNVVAGLDEQAAAGQAAGESQEDLNAKYNAGRDALINQLVQMGYTVEQAGQLVDAYKAIPDKVTTTVTLEGFSTAYDHLTTLQSKLSALSATRSTPGVVIPRGETGQTFDVGGWTGDLHPKAVAGVVHGQEFVVKAGPAAANRGVLEAMNAGAYVPGYEAGGYVTAAATTVTTETAPAAGRVEYHFHLPGPLAKGVRPTDLVHAIKAHEATREPRR